ncbi:MAG: hypothetical protein PHI11_07085 [Gallionella sp.]|nr:hypothetical protein [Gallionella sp.]
MNEQIDQATDEDPKMKTGGFFTVNLSQIDSMVMQEAGAEEVMAYLVLARGCGKNSTTAHGANSIANRTGLTHYKAEQSMEWLIDGGYILKHEGVEGKKRLSRWQLTEQMDEHELALANALMDGIGRGKDNPPLTRIYNEVGMGNHMMLKDARLDALMVLLHLYRHHLMADYGGVNPRAGIFRNWQAADNFNGEQVVDVEGTNAALYEIEGGSNTMYLKFAEEALFYVADTEERNVRFWDAFHNLHKLGFMYEVTQVWSGNPEKDNKAEPLYTLYIHDRHARESEPYLSKAIHSAAIRRGAMDAYVEFSHIGLGTDRGESANIGSGKFRFIAHKKVGGFPLGIYRLRFRAGTKDTGKGILAENIRVKHWESILAKL